VPVETIVRTIRDAALHVGNIRSSYPSPIDAFNLYLRWADDMIRQLGPLLSPVDVQRLIATPRYWVMQGIDPAAHGNLISFVNLELDERFRALSEAGDHLDQAMKRWRGRTGRLILPDTNLYLHHPEPFDTVNWAAMLANELEDVHLVVPMLVVDELDRQKRSGDKTVRTRARTTIRRLSELLPHPTTIGYLHNPGLDKGATTVELFLDDADHVRLPDADYELIDRASAVRDLADRPLTIITFDGGLAFRARALEVDVLHLPEE
jgi:hypothetical protein